MFDREAVPAHDKTRIHRTSAVTHLGDFKGDVQRVRSARATQPATPHRRGSKLAAIAPGVRTDGAKAGVVTVAGANGGRLLATAVRERSRARALGSES